MGDLFFIGFLIPILIVIGIVGLIVKFVTAPKGNRLDPDSWKKFGIGFSIALILPFMVGYGFTTFVDRPVMDYSYQSLEPQQQHNRDVGGESQPPTYYSDGSRTNEITVEEYRIARTAFEEARSAAQTKYTDERFDFHTYMFISFISAGVIALVAGLMTAIPAASIGVLYGGILSVLFGFASYWEFMNNGAIFVALLITFIVLIYAAYRRFKPEDKAA